MVQRGRQNRTETPARQGLDESRPRPNKINASTRYDFSARSLTPYGGLLPVATMMEKLGFQDLVEETITCSRKTRAMGLYQFVLAIVLGLYVGFERLNQLRFIAQDPLVIGILNVDRLPGQSTLWRFLASLGRHVSDQLLRVQQRLRERVWAAANVKLAAVTLDTDTTVHTLYGQQMGARKSYNPKNKGKLSYQPILTFIAETREYLMGGLHNGDRPSGKEIAAHIRRAVRALPPGIQTVYARADSGFYCGEAIEAYRQMNCKFVVVARKTSRLLGELKTARWTGSPKTDADAQCEFRYRPDGWDQECRFVALRYEKEPETSEETEQYQLFETAQYLYRVFVTNMAEPIADVVWFYNQRAGAENLIKEANNDCGLAAHPSKRFDMNGNHFQMAMLAYNLNVWLQLFHRDPEADVASLRHTTLAIARLRFLFIAAKLWTHAGRAGIRYSDHYPEQGTFDRLMDRLRKITRDAVGWPPVIAAAFA